MIRSRSTNNPIMIPQGIFFPLTTYHPLSTSSPPSFTNRLDLATTSSAVNCCQRCMGILAKTFEFGHFHDFGQPGYLVWPDRPRWMCRCPVAICAVHRLDLNGTWDQFKFFPYSLPPPHFLLPIPLQILQSGWYKLSFAREEKTRGQERVNADLAEIQIVNQFPSIFTEISCS